MDQCSGRLEAAGVVLPTVTIEYSHVTYEVSRPARRHPAVGPVLKQTSRQICLAAAKLVTHETFEACDICLDHRLTPLWAAQACRLWPTP